jgi:hypothetical protein
VGVAYRNRYPRLFWSALGKVHKMLAGPPFITYGSPLAANSAFSTWICSWYMPITNRPAMKAPKICEKMSS